MPRRRRDATGDRADDGPSVGDSRRVAYIDLENLDDGFLSEVMPNTHFEVVETHDGQVVVRSAVNADDVISPWVMQDSYDSFCSAFPASPYDLEERRIDFEEAMQDAKPEDATTLLLFMFWAETETRLIELAHQDMDRTKAVYENMKEQTRTTLGITTEQASTMSIDWRPQEALSRLQDFRAENSKAAQPRRMKRREIRRRP